MTEDAKERRRRLWTCRKTNYMNKKKMKMMTIIIIIIIIIIIDINVSCHRPFLPGTSLEPAVIPIAQASSFTLQYFPYCV